MIKSGLRVWTSTNCLKLFFIFYLLIIPIHFSFGIPNERSDYIRAVYETWEWSSEELGMMGWAFERSYNEHSYIALQTWMAMQGERGGFITLGFDGGYRFDLSPDASLDTGMYLGAGGGRWLSFKWRWLDVASAYFSSGVDGMHLILRRV